MSRPRATAIVFSALLSVVAPAVALASDPAAAGTCTVVTVTVHHHRPTVWVCPPVP